MAAQETGSRHFFNGCSSVHGCRPNARRLVVHLFPFFPHFHPFLLRRALLAASSFFLPIRTTPHGPLTVPATGRVWHPRAVSIFDRIIIFFFWSTFIGPFFRTPFTLFVDWPLASPISRPPALNLNAQNVAAEMRCCCHIFFVCRLARSKFSAAAATKSDEFRPSRHREKAKVP